VNLRIKKWLIERPVAACMILLLAAQITRAEPLPGQEPTAGQETQGASPTATQQENPAPNSAPATTTQSPEVEAPSSSGTPPPGPQSAPNGDQSVPASGSQASPDQQQNGTAQPVGTAAAPAVKDTGVAGSRVSGAAIAPGKQRRVHTFLISLAVVAAACVAVGTVAALTHSTPSQPR
jgi:hypothetical protein